MTLDNYTQALFHLDNDYLDKVSNKSGVGSNTKFADGKFGSGVVLNGNNSYITIPDSSVVDFQNNDFTIDFWCKILDSTSNRNFFAQRNSGAEFQPIGFGCGPNIYYLNITYTLSSWAINAIFPTTIPEGFFHVALIRKENFMHIYQNGKLIGSVNITSSLPTSSRSFSIGSTGIYGDVCINGIIDEFRISKGIARWSSNFIPPADPYGTDSYDAYKDPNEYLYGYK